MIQTSVRHILNGMPAFRGRSENELLYWMSKVVTGVLTDRGRYNTTAGRSIFRENTEDPREHFLREKEAIATASRQAMAREDILRLEAELAKLSEDERAIVIRSRYLGQSSREIGEAMGRSESSVRQLLRRTLIKLSQRLCDQSPEQKASQVGGHPGS